MDGNDFNTPCEHTNHSDQFGWPLVGENTQQGQDLYCINPREMHHTGYPVDLHSTQVRCDTPLSAPVSAAHSPYLQGLATPLSHRATPASFGSADDNRSSIFLDTASADEGGPDANEPYNRLLHRCLMEAPNHERLLKDIYEWFKIHTDKGRDPKSKGWQNSIRHNLSMNPAFQKGSRTHQDSGAANMWCLSESAIAGRIEPTTRFRNSNNKSGSRNKTRSAGPPGAMRSTRNYARTQSAHYHPYENHSSIQEPHFTSHHHQPTSYPQDEQSSEAMADLHHDALCENIGAWNNAVVGHDNSAPYFVTDEGTLQPVHQFYFDTQSSLDYGITGTSSNMNPDFAPAIAASQSQAIHPEFLTPQRPRDAPAQRYGQSSGEGRGLVSLPRSPAVSTPSLEGQQIDGVYDDARGQPLFMSDDESSTADQDGIQTPPEVAGSGRGFTNAIKQGEVLTSHQMHALYGS